MPVSFLTNHSARSAAFVFESSPPIITTAERFSFLQTSNEDLNCSSVSNLVLPDPIISKPPVFLYSSINESVNSTYLPSIIPDGPPKNPYNLFSGFACFNASYKPAITLCPPGACPPERITPTFLTSVFCSTSLPSKVTIGIP